MGRKKQVLKADRARQSQNGTLLGSSNFCTPLGMLGRLPIELRLAIYGYIFDKHYLVSCEYVLRDTIPRFPALLQTSSVVRQEAQEVVYNNSTFRYSFRLETKEVRTRGDVRRSKNAECSGWHIARVSTTLQNRSKHCVYPLLQGIYSNTDESFSATKCIP